MPKVWRVRTPAKINLGLRIVGRNSNGYHLLQSLFWPISLFDEVTLTENPFNSCEFQWADGPIENRGVLPPGDNNTISKVLQLVDSQTKLSATVKKNIPVEAGLGGGSSNAGSLLRWFVDEKIIPEEQADSWARQIGADVPFFLRPVPTWVEGFGEKRMPLEVDPSIVERLLFLLVFPPFGCSTKAVFSHYREQGSTFSAPLPQPQNLPLSWNALAAYLSTAKNDLEKGAAALHPGLEPLLSALRRLSPLYSGVSGSGSTCFAVFDRYAYDEKRTQGFLEFLRIHNCRSFMAVTHREEQKRHL